MTLIAIHLLQNHAPSNLNRDDNGDPKDALFGGIRRARISSQAIKRSIRWSPVFREAFSDAPHMLGERTQLLPELVRAELSSSELAPQAQQAIVNAAARLGKGDSKPTSGSAGDSKPEGKKGKTARKADEPPAAERLKTAQLMFLTGGEIRRLTERLTTLVHERGIDALNSLGGDSLAEIVGSLEPHAADIAMFGRMTTSSPFKNIEAAVQVAHALSTHAVEQEFDFYTAVDDISGESGAGFIGDTAFNSATYYKYLSIDWGGLLSNLAGDRAAAGLALRALVRAAMFAIPSGKQNTFAAHNLPDLALIEVRRQKIALSYANAFVRPVRAGAGRSLVEASAQALQEYIPQINGIYGLAAERALITTVPFTLAGARHCDALPDMIDWLGQQMADAA